MRKLFTSWALVQLLSALLLMWLPSAAWAQTWTTIAPTGTPRWVGFSVMINNRMYVFSGFDSPSVTTTPKCEVYNPTTNTWSYIADMPYPVTHAGITVDGTKVYVAGGFLGGLAGDPNSDLLQIYDVTTNTWSFGPKLPSRSGGNQLVRVGRKLHSFGGMLDDRQTGATAHYVLDLSNTAAGWGSAASMPVPRCHLASANVGGKIYVFGGQTGHDGPIEDVDIVQMYDPSTDTWTQLKNMPYVRSHSEPGTFVLDGKVTLVGGRSGRINGTDVVINKVTTYDPATDSWTEKTPLPVNLFGPAAEVIGSELFVADGGLNQSTNPQTTARKIGWSSTPINRIGFLPSTLNLSAAVGATTTKQAILWTLSGNPSYTIDPSSVPAWLTVSPTSGTVDLLGGTEIKVTATGTTAGSYSATLVAKAAGYPDATLNVTFNVSTSKPQVLYLYGSMPPAIHDMKLTDTGDRGMSQFNQVLLDAGFSTTQALDASITLDAATLNKYKVVILSSNNRRFTAAERTAVANWVNAGGGLVAWSDAAFGWENGGLNSSEGSVSDNDLTQQFGMQFLHDNGAPVFTLNQWTANHYLNKFNKNAGVTIEAEGASPIRTSAPATILAYLPAAQAYLNSQDGNITSADAALAVAKIGQGRVLGCFDRNAFWNNGEGTFLSRAENRTFAQRLVLWASGVDDSTTPTANAGPNKAITLPANSTTLSGSGFDDGPIASYTWTQVSGPNTAVFTSKTVAQPTVSNLIAGSYVFSLVVTDNSGQSSAASQTIVTVNPAAVGGTPLYRIHAAGGALNTSIGAFADDQYYNGNGQTYGNSNSISGTEDDALYQTERYGNSFGYAFPVSSGQQYRVVLHFAEIYATNIGQRVFDVSVEGNKVLDNYDIFKKVGTNVATTESFTTVADDVLNINFSSLAADGGVDNAKISAIEVYRLNQNPGNVAPVANAGPDQSITLPVSNVQLSGSGSDSDGNPITYAWTQVSGPNTAVFSNKAIAQPSVSGLVAGSYVFSLIVTDNAGAASPADQVTVLVSPASSGGVTALYRLNAGGPAVTASGVTFSADNQYVSGGNAADSSNPIAGTVDDVLYQTERWGTMTYALPVANGTYTVKLHFAEVYWGGAGQRVFDVSAEGTKVLAAYDILKKVGQNTATIETLTVTVTDGQLNLAFAPGTAGADEPKVSAIEVLTTGSTTNQPPVANAGPDKSITLPVSNVQLLGAGTDAEGSLLTYAWTQVSGPSTAVFTSKTVAQPTVSNLVAGPYVFSLIVTDNAGLASPADQVTVTVNPASTGGGTVVHRINAGGPAVTTSGMVFSADQYVSGGNVADSFNPIAGTTDDVLYQTERWGSMTYNLPVSNGSYTVKLHFAEVYWSAPGQRVFDVAAEGAKVLSAYDIVKKVGQNTATIETFTVTVTDGQLTLAFAPGTAGADEPKVSAIEVLTAGSVSNQPPVANAGPDKSITLPVSNVQLSGSGNDADGNVTSYAWTQVSGPNTAAFSNASAAQPMVSGLVAGAYVFSLVVTDNAGLASAADQVSVTVNSAPTTGQQLVSFSLINADSNQPIQTLVAGQVLNLATLPTRNLNIRANTNPTAVGSVHFVLSGAASQVRTETAAPYALFADASGDYYAWTPPVGSYTLQATPYTGAGATGTAGTPLTLNFSVIDQAARTSASQTATVQSTTATNVSAQVQVYPNPSADGRYQVQLPAAFQGEVNYSLVSAQGLVVRRGTATVSGGTLPLDFSQQMLAQGIYHLQLTSNKAQAQVKLLRH